MIRFAFINKLVILLIASLFAGCATKQPMPSEQVTLATDSNELVKMSFGLVDAYQKDDAGTWNASVCTAEKEGSTSRLSGVKFLGAITSPRLVSVSSVSGAGNSSGMYKNPLVVIEVNAENYPIGKLLLKFIYDGKGKCMVVIF